MKRFHSLLSWLAPCVFAFALGGCAVTAPMPAEPALPPIRAGTIARLMVDGPNAFINGQRVAHGSYVIDGDTVSTGPATSVRLLLNEGGEIQLDENTDPLFKKGACLLMRMLRGRAALQNTQCQEFADGVNMAGVARSYIHILSTENDSRVTVIAGEVEMRSPSQAILHRNDEYVATREGAVQVLQLTQAEADARVAWTRNFFRPQARAQSGGMSPGQVGAIGAGIGALLDVITRNRQRAGRPPAGQTSPTGRQSDATPTNPAQSNPRSIDNSTDTRNN